ncbi:hypothetical protein ABCR94_06890 [Streptomyces sp. 21So2-11]|uniref:hypothetical protein n=1 Tax=Streptomyces sp. 21So2-11 TaxID=3144408 RepID=UPI0032194B45
MFDQLRDPVGQRPAVLRLTVPEHSPSGARYGLGYPFLAQYAEGSQRHSARDVVLAHDVGQ